MTLIICLDVGQERDPTSLCVVGIIQRHPAGRERSEVHLLVRQLERPPLKASYPKIARVGTHDDLVTALGLAVQVDRPVPMGYAVRLR